MLTILRSFGIWSKCLISGLDKWVPHELTENFKKSLFWSVVFSYSTEQQAISQIVTCDEKWILWQPATSVAGLRRSSKALSKAKHAPKQVMVTGGLLLVWPTTAFWGPAKHYIWEVCSANWWDAPKTAMPATSIDQQNRPILLHDNAQLHCTQPALQKLKEWATKFGIIRHIHPTSCQPTTVSSSISTTFCTGNTSTTSRRQKMLSKSSLNPEAWILMLQEQTNLFLFAKCVDCNGSCFD